jgi:hypothetical protein
LALSKAELNALRTQGFVSRERTAAGTEIAKLRFRVGKVQRVVYLGVDGAGSNAVRAALANWQRARRTDAMLRPLVREAACILRATKKKLIAPLSEVGLRFHGRAIRQRRYASSGSATDR